MRFYPWLKEQELAHLNCLIPIHHLEDGGNYTELWFSSGKKYLAPNRLKTVIQYIACYLGVNIKQELAAWATEARRHALPLVLGPNFTLVPVLVRRPPFRDAGGTGYVVRQKILSWEKVEEGEFRTCLWLAGGQRLFCLLNPLSLLMRLAEADKVTQRSQKLYAQLLGQEETHEANL